MTKPDQSAKSSTSRLPAIEEEDTSDLGTDGVLQSSPADFEFSPEKRTLPTAESLTTKLIEIAKGEISQMVIAESDKECIAINCFSGYSKKPPKTITADPSSLTDEAALKYINKKCFTEDSNTSCTGFLSITKAESDEEVNAEKFSEALIAQQNTAYRIKFSYLDTADNGQPQSIETDCIPDLIANLGKTISIKSPEATGGFDSGMNTSKNLDFGKSYFGKLSNHVSFLKTMFLMAKKLDTHCTNSAKGKKAQGVNFDDLENAVKSGDLKKLLGYTESAIKVFESFHNSHELQTFETESAIKVFESFHNSPELQTFEKAEDVIERPTFFSQHRENTSGENTSGIPDEFGAITLSSSPQAVVMSNNIPGKEEATSKTKGTSSEQIIKQGGSEISEDQQRSGSKTPSSTLTGPEAAQPSNSQSSQGTNSVYWC